MREKNPFITQGYVDPEHFCDREKETKTLLGHIENGRNVTLLAPRRYGKSGLIQHAFRLHKDDYAFIYVDLLATTSLADFTRVLASEMVNVLDTRLEKAVSAFSSFFKSVRPTMKPDSDGSMTFSFEMANTQSETTLKMIFDYLEHHTDREIVIALDEFQQVAKYPETGTEAMLRSRIQFLPYNIHFIFAGSQMHLLSEMFASPKRPFYQSTAFLPLDVISESIYCDFAAQFYKKAGRSFNPEVFQSIYRRFDGVTWYVQAVLNALWSAEEGLTDERQVDAAVASLVESRALNFHDLDVSQSDSARALLRAIARQGCVATPTAAAFIAEYGLKAPSTVAGALRQLLENELIYKTEKGYIVYDRLFAEYLKTR